MKLKSKMEDKLNIRGRISGFFESRVKNKYNRKRYTGANISSQVSTENYLFTRFNIKHGI